MSEECKADTRPYMGLIQPKDEADARKMFRFKYNREPEAVLPPSANSPYWKAGPLTDEECKRWRGFVFQGEERE